MPAISQTIPVTAFVGGKDRQAIDNGDFTVWQRGTNILLTASSMVADRWRYVTDDTTATVRFRKASEWSPSFDIPVEAGKDGILFQFSSGAFDGSARYLSQLIPDVRYGAEGIVTVSFWMWGATPDEIAQFYEVSLVQHFGGSEPSVEVPLTGKILVPSATWNYVQFSGIMPSVADTTITDGGFVELRLYIVADDDGFVHDTIFCSVQMNVGSRAMPFLDRGPVEEEAACKRYFERIHVAVGEWIAILHGRDTTPARGTLHYSEKWANPTSITISNNAHFNIVRNTAVITVSAFSMSDANRNQANISVTGGDANPQIDWIYWLASTNAAAYIDVSAEPSV